MGKFVRAAVVLLLCLLCFGLSGCSLKLADINEVIRPPKPYGTNDELQKAFEESAGADVLFKAPVSGDYLSSFVIKDIDSDGGDEAVVFYCESSLDTVVKMSLFDYSDGGWQHLLTRTGSGCDVYSIDFCDMDGNGTDEIILSWSLFDSKSNKMLSVYELSKENSELTELSAEMFTMKKLLDADGDGKDEILLLHLDSNSEKQTSSAKLLKMTGAGAVKLVDKRILDGNISGYVSIKTDEKSEPGEPSYIYIDAAKGETQMITEVLLWSNSTKSLATPLFDADTQSNTVTWRSIRAESRDIDNDGRIEIPAQEAIKGGETRYVSENLTNKFFITSWLRVENGKCVTVRRSFIKASDSCVFYIPSELEGSITVVDMAETNRWDVYMLDSATGERGELLFSLIFTTDEDWKRNKNELYEAYSVLFESGDKKVIVSYFTSEGGIAIDGDMLSECFEYFE